MAHNPQFKRWATKIRAAWQKSVDSIFECASLLIAANDEIKHGEFQKMIETELPFGPSTAQRLMKIGRDQRLRKAARAQLLPPSWYTLYRLTLLSDEEFQALLDHGTINPDMERDDILVPLRFRFIREEPKAIEINIDKRAMELTTIIADIEHQKAEPTLIVPGNLPLFHTRLSGYTEPVARGADGGLFTREETRPAISDRVRQIIEHLEALEEIADQSIMDELIESLHASEMSYHLFRIRHALHAIDRFEAKLDQAENSLLADNRRH